jgi:hypothetical protein
MTPPVAPHTSFEFLLPASFDVAAYSGVRALAPLVADPNDDTNPAKKNAYLGHSAAWTGVAVRLGAASEYNSEFAKSIARSTAPPLEERYRQERALYGCLSSTLSAVECAYIAAYCLSSALAPEQLPLTSAKHLNQRPQKIAMAFDKWVAGDPFAVMLLTVATSEEIQALADFRNMLAHRGVLPRHHRLSNAIVQPSTLPSNPKSLAVEFNYNANMSPDTTGVHFNWASRACSDISAGFLAFLRARTSHVG